MEKIIKTPLFSDKLNLNLIFNGYFPVFEKSLIIRKNNPVVEIDPNFQIYVWLESEINKIKETFQDNLIILSANHWLVIIGKLEFNINLIPEYQGNNFEDYIYSLLNPNLKAYYLDKEYYIRIIPSEKTDSEEADKLILEYLKFKKIINPTIELFPLIMKFLFKKKDINEFKNVLKNSWPINLLHRDAICQFFFILIEEVIKGNSHALDMIEALSQTEISFNILNNAGFNPLEFAIKRSSEIKINSNKLTYKLLLILTKKPYIRNGSFINFIYDGPLKIMNPSPYEKKVFETLKTRQIKKIENPELLNIIIIDSMLAGEYDIYELIKFIKFNHAFIDSKMLCDTLVHHKAVCTIKKLLENKIINPNTKIGFFCLINCQLFVEFKESVNQSEFKKNLPMVFKEAIKQNNIYAFTFLMMEYSDLSNNNNSTEFKDYNELIISERFLKWIIKYGNDTIFNLYVKKYPQKYLENFEFNNKCGFYCAKYNRPDLIIYCPLNPEIIKNIISFNRSNLFEIYAKMYPEIINNETLKEAAKNNNSSIIKIIENTGIITDIPEDIAEYLVFYSINTKFQYSITPKVLKAYIHGIINQP